MPPKPTSRSQSVPAYAATFFQTDDTQQQQQQQPGGHAGPEVSYSSNDDAGSFGSRFTAANRDSAAQSRYSTQRRSSTSLGKAAAKSNRSGIAVALFVTFLASVCFSIVLPSIWPFLQTMGAEKSMVGWAVAVNSAGSFVASPLFGWWMDKRSTREVLAVSLILMIGGNVMYSLATNVWVLLIARFVVGVAAANYACAQAYLAYATNVDNRTSVMALNSAANVLGFIIGPAFALVTTALPSFSIEEVHITPLTSPGYISAIMSLFGLFALVFLREIPPEERDPANAAGGLGDDPADDPDLPYLGHNRTMKNASLKYMPARMPKSSSASFTYGMHVGPMSGGSVKSLAQMIRTVKYEMAEHPDASSQGSSAYEVPGSIQNMDSGRTGKRTEEVPLLGSGEQARKPISRKTVIAVVVCLFAYFAYTTSFTVFETIGTQYTEQDKFLKWNVRDNSILYAGLGVVCIISLVLLQIVIALLKATDRILVTACTVFCIGGYLLLLKFGNEYQYVNMPRFLASLIIAGAGYATSTAVLFSLFSKVLEGLDQGMMMGWLSSAGSIARIVGPVFASYCMQYSGPFAVFASVAALLLVTLVMLLVFWRQLAPVEDVVEEVEDEERGHDGLGEYDGLSYPDDRDV